METHFASPEKAEPGELAIECEVLKKSAVISGLLQSVGGLLAVLNEHRQVVALNDSFLKRSAFTILSRHWGCVPVKRCIAYMPRINLRDVAQHNIVQAAEPLSQLFPALSRTSPMRDSAHCPPTGEK